MDSSYTFAPADLRAWRQAMDAPKPRPDYSRVFRPLCAEDDRLMQDYAVWVVRGLLCAGYVAVLGGAPKQGKSCLATALAHAVASGRPFANLETGEPRPVLWLAFEESWHERAWLNLQAPHILRSQLHFDEAPDKEIPCPIFTSYAGDHPPLDTPEGYACLEENIAQHRARLVIVDSLYGAVARTNLADNWGARRLMMHLKTLAVTHNCAILAIHHLTKSQSRGVDPDRFADSSQILAAASMHIHFERVEAKDAPDAINLSISGRGPWANRTLSLETHGPLDYTLAHPRGDTAETRILAALAQKGSLTCAQLRDLTGYGAGTVRNALSRLEKRRHITKKSPAHHRQTYSLPQ